MERLLEALHNPSGTATEVLAAATPVVDLLASPCPCRRVAELEAKVAAMERVVESAKSFAGEATLHREPRGTLCAFCGHHWPCDWWEVGNALAALPTEPCHHAWVGPATGATHCRTCARPLLPTEPT